MPSYKAAFIDLFQLVQLAIELLHKLSLSATVF